MRQQNKKGNWTVLTITYVQWSYSWSSDSHGQQSWTESQSRCQNKPQSDSSRLLSHFTKKTEKLECFSPAPQGAPKSKDFAHKKKQTATTFLFSKRSLLKVWKMSHRKTSDIQCFIGTRMLLGYSSPRSQTSYRGNQPFRKESATARGRPSAHPCCAGVAVRACGVCFRWENSARTASSVAPGPAWWTGSFYWPPRLWMAPCPGQSLILLPSVPATTNRNNSFPLPFWSRWFDVLAFQWLLPKPTCWPNFGPQEGVFSEVLLFPQMTVFCRNICVQISTISEDEGKEKAEKTKDRHCRMIP